MKLHKSVICPISLFIGLLVYYSLAIIAIFNYSGGFDIYNDLWTHLRWFEYNLDGALYFRIGNVTYALTLIIFFLSVNGWITAVTERRSPIYLIQVIGISIAGLMILGEILADQAIIFAIASGTSLLLTVIILIGIPILLYSHPEFWKVSILLFIISIVLSSYLLYMGITDAPIREFRIIDFLVTAFNQVSIFTIALNITKMETH
ncbi:MAG: hypothetical protein AM325_013215 [Candidatus Thorarchaeota archaeon SMTZ1-45]